MESIKKQSWVWRNISALRERGMGLVLAFVSLITL